ncbi:hypothetical protein [Noviherbaspirillum aerium]|uniref:hypothetical protein n=1 Tax=Noviherbaspirillum aerium TaxID=2588497 RepID=UPI00124DB5F8|nr:hypothetical protein [Noviherbaspirillum aerium]
MKYAPSLALHCHSLIDPCGVSNAPEKKLAGVQRAYAVEADWQKRTLADEIAISAGSQLNGHVIPDHAYLLGTMALLCIDSSIGASPSIRSRSSAFQRQRRFPMA